MKQIRITSEHFVPRGEQGYPDAGMDPADLRRLKQLAGVPVNEDYYQAGGHDPAIDTPNNNDQAMPSVLGGIGNKNVTDKRKIEKEKGIKPGSDEWFKLWFAKPLLTGEKPVGDAPAPRIDRMTKKPSSD